jgi:phosphate transport system permease protein
VITAADPKKRAKDAAFHLLLLACLGAGVALLFVLIGTVFHDGAGRVNGNLITHQPSMIDVAGAGFRSAILGTLWLMLVVIVFIVPVGVGAAIYLEEYADRSKWWNRLVEVNIQNLAAVPSVVYGILGLAFLVRGPLGMGRVVLAGGLTLGLLVLPVVIIAAREAIRAVPSSIREGALALGATQWQMIWRQVLPSAVPGVATGVILAVSRAIGETAPLILVGAATFVSFDPSGLNSPFSAMPLQIFNWLSSPQQEFHVLAAAGILVLLALLLTMNAGAIFLRNRYEQKW